MQPDNEQGAAPGDLRVRQTLFDDQGATLNMAGPTRVTPGAEDQFLYVVANEDSAIVVFERLSLDVVFDDDFRGLANSAPACRNATDSTVNGARPHRAPFPWNCLPVAQNALFLAS